MAKISAADQKKLSIVRDTKRTEAERVAALIGLMTLKEKVACLSTDPKLPRLGLRLSGHVEGLHGLSQGGPANWTPKRKVPTTVFPQSYGLGATWDPELIQRVAAVEGFEARYIFQSPEYRQGALIVFAPNADMGRDPRWGRTEECYGEDPFLTGRLAQAFVKGLQGGHPNVWLCAALMKHFLANSHENERESTSSDFDERQWREYYSVPFRMGVEAGSRAYMAAYNAHNGIPCHIHPMLKEITVKEWGMDGMIITDGGGLKLLVSAHKAFPDKARAAAAIIKSGIGRFLDDYKNAVDEALEKGYLNESDIDQVLRGTFRVMNRLGLFDPEDQNPYREVGTGPEPWNTDTHRKLARDVTRRSIILLKNEGLLPLVKDKVKKVAVVGSMADEVHLDWYSGLPPYRVTALEGIKAALGTQVEVLHAKSGPDAVAAAKEADVAIVIVGNHPTGDGGWAKVKKKSYGKEAVDRESIDLEDEALVKRIFKANSNTVLVLMSSFPYAINWSQANLPAILHMVHGCQETGNGLADVLFGDFNPAARTTQTWVKSLEDLPPRLDYDLRKGRTYMYFEGEPLYPFGFGLSYTDFDYSNLRLSASSLAEYDSVTVEADITNVGGKDGEEVVQLYVSRPDSKFYRPLRQLRGFERVFIGKGRTRTVTFELNAQELAHWDAKTQAWKIEPGHVSVQVGRSSAQIVLETTLEVQS